MKTPAEWSIDVDNASAGPHLTGIIKVGAAALNTSGLDCVFNFEKADLEGIATAVSVTVFVTRDFLHERKIVLTPEAARLVPGQCTKR